MPEVTSTKLKEALAATIAIQKLRMTLSNTERVPTREQVEIRPLTKINGESGLALLDIVP